LQEEGTIAGGYLSKLKTQLSDLNLETQLLKATAIEQDASLTATNALPAMLDPLRGTESAASSPAGTERQTAFKELQLLKLQREKLSKYLRPKHPKIVKLDTDIERGQKLIDLFRTQSREQLTASQQGLKIRIESVQASIKDWETKVVEANGRIAEAERLKLNVARAQSVYDRLQMMVQNVDISRNIDQETLAILEPASPALRSYRLDVILLALAMIGGLVMGLGIVLLVELRDDRFISLTEVTEKLGDAIVGQVPEMGELRPKSPLPLLAPGDDRHMYAESYRSLRSAILYLATEGHRPKILLITSAVPNEGKSTIAVNLARTLAYGGSKVLLVDADLRKGILHNLMGLQIAPGLAELLNGNGNGRADHGARTTDLVPQSAASNSSQSSVVDSPIQFNSLPNLAFMARGENSSHPGDLFLNPNLDRLFAQWRQQFDYVLIDSSPVFAADDATTLAAKADGTLFVVRSGYSGARATREAVELLYRRQAKVLGVIFNRADTSARSYYYYKYADYHGSGTKLTTDQQPHETPHKG